jgi:hypothetical protein
MLTLVVLCSASAVAGGISQSGNQAIHSTWLPISSLAIKAESPTVIGSDQQLPDSTLDCSDAVDSIIAAELQSVVALVSTSLDRVKKSHTLNDHSRATQERGPPSPVF